MATYIAGAGGGGKGGGGSTRVAKEAPNTLRSKSYAKIVEVLCEGEIEGIVNGAEGIYLDGTPIQNPDGTFNFEDIVIETREGTLSQSITKIGTTTESTASLGTEVKKDVPVLYTITNGDVDRARVSIQVPALTQQNPKNGDLNGSSVTLTVEYMPSGGDWISPNVNTTSFALSPTTSHTGYKSFSGSLDLQSNSVKVQIQTTEGSRQVDKYLPMSYTFQYNKDNSGWITLKSGSGIFYSPAIKIPSITTAPESPSFTLPAVEASTYAFRLLVTSGSGTIQKLAGVKTTNQITITGKTTSPYQRDVDFSLSGAAPWIIRVTRLTSDSTSSTLQNKTYLSSVTSVFEEKFRYPATAYVALSIDAEQFSSIPSRSYDVKLLKIKIPTNYNPITREYTGVWDGTFKTEWSDNPAWCFYDLVTNRRYGLGERIDPSQVDKWVLYDIAQYCDELVDDGFGVAAPRFTCNLIIQTREEAYKVLQDMASVFAGITYWGSTSDGFYGIIPVQDKPEDTHSYLFNNSNVADGVFSYQTASATTQYNAVYVTYNDPADEYKQKVVYVPDEVNIAVDGFVNETSVVAFGCTSKAQAIRQGRRMLFTNRYENDVVSFATGFEGVVPSVGSVIEISDQLRAGERRGGRVVDRMSDTSVLIDANFNFQPSVIYKITLIGFDGVVGEFDVVNPETSTDVIPVSQPLPAQLSKNSAYIITDSSLESSQFKVVSVTETEGGLYNVSAVKHVPSKYLYIDSLAPIQQIDDSSSDTRDPVTDISGVEVLYADGTTIRSKLVLSWKPAKFSSFYRVSYSVNNSNVISVETNTPSLDILNTEEGDYNISIVSVNILGAASGTASFSFQVVGKLSPPSDIEDFSISAFANAANATWKLHPDLDVNIGGFIYIRHTSKTVGYKWEDGSPIAMVAGNATSAIVPLLSGTYMAKAVDASGIYSTNAVFSDSSFAQLQQLNVVVTNSQQPDWVGDKTNTAKVGDVLTLLSDGAIDDVTSFIDELTSIDLLDFSVLSTGEYEFDSYIDIGQVATSRVTSAIEYLAYDLADQIDSRTTNIDDWISFDGAVINSSYVTLFISTTDDDPSSLSAAWTSWKSFIVADYKARGFKFKLVFTNPVPTNNIDVSSAEITIDMPDRVEGRDDIICPVGGYSVVYSAPFYVKPSVAVRIDDMQQGDWWEITNNTASGFDIKFRDSVGNYVSRQFDYISKGYGYVFI